MKELIKQVPTKQIKVGSCFFCDPILSGIKAIIGLGNPEPKFSKTRHNIGFDVTNSLAELFGFSFSEKELYFEGLLVSKDGRKILCFKPKTYMNHSGKILPVLLKQGIAPHEIMVIHDELEKPLEYLSIRFSGGARGHNGLRSIIATVGSDFWRLCFGIGRPDDETEIGDFVVAKFSKNEIPLVEKTIKRVDDFFACNH